MKETTFEKGTSSQSSKDETLESAAVSQSPQHLASSHPPENIAPYDFIRLRDMQNLTYGERMLVEDFYESLIRIFSIHPQQKDLDNYLILGLTKSRKRYCNFVIQYMQQLNKGLSSGYQLQGLAKLLAFGCGNIYIDKNTASKIYSEFKKIGIGAQIAEHYNVSSKRLQAGIEIWQNMLCMLQSKEVVIEDEDKDYLRIILANYYAVFDQTHNAKGRHLTRLAKQALLRIETKSGKLKPYMAAGMLLLSASMDGLYIVAAVPGSINSCGLSAIETLPHLFNIAIKVYEAAKEVGQALADIINESAWYDAVEIARNNIAFWSYLYRINSTDRELIEDNIKTVFKDLKAYKESDVKEFIIYVFGESLIQLHPLLSPDDCNWFKDECISLFNDYLLSESISFGVRIFALSTRLLEGAYLYSGWLEWQSRFLKDHFGTFQQHYFPKKRFEILHEKRVIPDEVTKALIKVYEAFAAKDGHPIHHHYNALFEQKFDYNQIITLFAKGIKREKINVPKATKALCQIVVNKALLVDKAHMLATLTDLENLSAHHTTFQSMVRKYAKNRQLVSSHVGLWQTACANMHQYSPDRYALLLALLQTKRAHFQTHSLLDPVSQPKQSVFDELFVHLKADNSCTTSLEAFPEADEAPLLNQNKLSSQTAPAPSLASPSIDKGKKPAQSSPREPILAGSTCIYPYCFFSRRITLEQVPTKQYKAQSSKIFSTNAVNYRLLSGDEIDLYSAINLYLGSVDSKERVISFIEKNQKLLEAQLINDKNIKDYLYYLQNGETQSPWDEHFEIETLMQALGRPIIVLGSYQQLIDAEALSRFPDKPIFVYRSSHGGYKAVLLQPLATAQDGVENEVAEDIVKISQRPSL